MPPLDKRYARELLPPSLAYILINLTVWPLVRLTDQVGLRVLIALTPLVPLAFMVRAFVRYVLDSDELQRRLHLEALAVAASAVGLLSMTAGLLVAGKVLPLDGGILLWVFPALCVLYGLARCQIARRYARE